MASYKPRKPQGRPSRMQSHAKWRLITALLALAAAVTLILAVVASPCLTVRRVNLVVADLPLESENRCVRSHAAIPPGTSLVLMDVKRYSDEIRRLPWVRSVRVRRYLDRSVTVEVDVRRPVVRLVCGGRRWEVDDDGVVIRPARRDVALLEVALDAPRPIIAGAQLDAEEVLGAIAAVRMSRSAGVLNPVCVTVDQRNGICFNNADNVAVWLGEAEDLPYKLALVARMYRIEPTIAQRLQTIDVSMPQVPAGTPRVTSDAKTGSAPDAG